MNKERLTTLAKHLYTVPPETFDLGDWSCGTVACAVGHACTMPEFQAEGLGFCACEHEEARPAPEFRGSIGWSAVTCFFGLTFDESQELFAEGEYERIERTPAHVADRILAFVKDSK